MNQELNAIILANGFLDLEWQDKEEQINNGQLLMQKELYKCFMADFDSFLLFLGFCDNSISLSVSLDYFRKITRLFTKVLIQTSDLEILKDKIYITPSEDEIDEMLNIAPFMTGAEYLNKIFLAGIFAKMNAKYQQEIKAYKGSVEEFIKAYSPDAHLVGRVFFHLVESKKEEYPFAFLATYSTNLNKQGKSKHIPLKYALTEYAKDNQKLLELLRTVYLAAKESSIIAGFLETGEIFHPLALTAKEAFNILKEIPIYEKSGILCRIPNWWKNKTARLILHINIGEKTPSSLGMDSILDFNPGLFLGDTSLTEEDVKRLLNESEGLAFIKGKWVEVDPEKLKKTLEAYEKARELMKKGNLSLKDAMYLQLNLQRTLELSDDEIVSVSNGEWLKSVIENLRNPELINSISPGDEFKGELRPYQQKGLNWLYFLHSLQFGACLADDMGLGKTIQLLALLNIIKKERKNKASLLIIPASLISNWINEITRFAPSINYYVAHPSQDKNIQNIKTDEEFLNKFDLVITTYSLTKKYVWLNVYQWYYVILDEAQAIKNPGTEQAKFIKKLSNVNRIIMTGTPIENRLSDLWSLFDFLNPGMIGNAKEFSEFTKNLQNNASNYTKLKKIISPYILRRLKTDKTVITDLPEKVEMKVYSDLSKKQIVLYSKFVEELKTRLENETEGINRKGLILASIMKFKQLCNHPDQYLGRDEYREEDSGKYLRLREICETICEKREKVLIFTQFKEISAPLKEYLETIFNHAGLLLHGGTPVNKRKEIVEKFQSHEYIPFMVLSIKAGGVGLNLTAANHVIHFDRWWNPAVENQATDRAFRIGQKKNVLVHKFITKGTIEEKIDTMLEEKADLSEDIIQKSNEVLITEMDNNKLMHLFKLSL